MSTKITIPSDLALVSPTVEEIRPSMWFIYTIAGGHGEYLGYKSPTGIDADVRFTFISESGPWPAHYPKRETRPFGSVRYLSGVEITALK